MSLSISYIQLTVVGDTDSILFSIAFDVWFLLVVVVDAATAGFGAQYPESIFVTTFFSLGLFVFSSDTFCEIIQHINFYLL